MRRWLVLRFFWLLASLLGITFLTFAFLDLAPVDRAELEAAQAAQQGAFPDARSRDAAVLRLRVSYGMADPSTLEPLPLGRRYLAWLQNAALLRFAGPNGDHAAIWRRLGEAMPVSALLACLSLLVAFGLGRPLGAWLGMCAGSRWDRAASRVLFLFAGVPEFLLAMLLLLTFGSAWLQWLPTQGLRTNGSEQWPLAQQVGDFARHLVLPVTVMSVGPFVLITRFLRDSVARAANAPFAASLRALGTPPAVVRRRVLHNASAPLATLSGSLLPMIVAGSIVVENMFSLDGLGHLGLQAVLAQDQAMVMALVVITSITTLLSLVVSDLLHHVIDARVRLRP
ncbi:MAG TPA: ABC transporter permease [Planctomycetota bacterium]|nr:ABC transporter permease [Planctomycetota bacterium]